MEIKKRTRVAATSVFEPKLMSEVSLTPGLSTTCCWDGGSCCSCSSCCCW